MCYKKQKNKTPKTQCFRGICGVPGRIRTSGLWSRSPTLYPAELRVHIRFFAPIGGAEPAAPNAELRVQTRR